MMLGMETDHRPDDAERRLSLSAQFAIMATIVMLLGMGAVGYWVGDRIASDVIRNTATATAFYVDSVIAPLTLDLPETGGFGEGPQLALRETLSQGALGGRITSFKLWRPDGTVVFATDESLIGRKFPLKPDLVEALEGQVHAELDSLDDEENRGERQSGIPLLEIYSPIREPWSGDVIGVAEFYENASALEQDILAARLRSWMVVGSVTVCMLGLFYLILLRSGRTIKRQREALKRKVAELSNALDQNEALRMRIQTASRRNAALTERGLRRISADLHDGPGQLLAFALLRLNAATASLAATDDLRAVRESLDEAMREVRNISRGAALPELDLLPPDEVLRRAVGAHEARTGTQVDLSIPGELPPLRQAEKICLYRFVQEGLNNATRHGNGVAQAVTAGVEDGELVVRVSDCGPGFDPAAPSAGLGLAGLEERLAALGGRFDVASRAGAGTRLTMRLPLSIEAELAA